MRILLLEDDRQLADVLARGLRAATYATDVARSCEEAEAHLRVTDYDVACLDLRLPDGDGLDLVRRLRDDGDLRRPERVLILTGRDAVADRVAGLDAGADDYLVKPFDFAELLARLRALARRDGRRDVTLRAGDLRLEPATRTAWRGARALDLTAREFALLEHFLRHPGEVLPAEHLLEHVWDANADPFTTAPRVILSRLRRKLGAPPVITTLPGAGYRLEAPP